jgi:Peptidase S24-like
LTSVQLPNGTLWDFKFVKVACNVAMPEGTKVNQLDGLLTEWFGPNAGLPGTSFTVRFNFADGGWHVSPMTIAALTSIEASIVEDRGPEVKAKVSKAAKFSTHVPVYDLVAAASGWGPEGSPQAIGWIEAPNQHLKEGMFAAWVSGRSMEPRIPTGSWCLFRPCLTGSRNGKLVLVQVNTHTDPEDGGRYTVKKYQSIKRSSNDGWEHETIELQPLNPDPIFKPIKVTAGDADSMRIIGEFVAVLATDQ